MGDTSNSSSPSPPGSPPQSKEDTRSTEAKPQDRFARLKWIGTLFVICLTTFISGYDVSNVANIQPRLYEAFGSIELLPWIGLSYCLSNFAVLSYSRKILYCLDTKWIYLVHMIVFMAGAAVSGAAPNMAAVIVGRIIMGVGAAVVYQCNLTFVAVFATPAQTPRLFGLLSAIWAVGLAIGGPIGSALAENPDTTWRWAFYLNLPIIGFGLFLSIICLPSKYLGPDIPLTARITAIDPVGITLNMATPVLFALALEFSGPVWDWGSAPSIAVWVVFGVLLIAWVLQQYFSIFTTEDERAVPVHLLARLDLLPLWIASGCAGGSYAVTLYYTPLYFAFAKGHDALAQTVRILPFVLVFIVVVMIVGGALPVFGRYNLVYIIAGVTTIAGSAAMAATMSPTIPEAQVMGLEALLGVGLGCSFQHGAGISNVINKDPRDRVDSAVLFNMAQMGGITIVLAVAGCIFQNLGFKMLGDALGDSGYSAHQLREALAGVSSSLWESSEPEAYIRGIEAVAEVIGREFYLVVAGGAVCLACGFAMKWEKLDYGRKKEGEDKG